MEFALGAHGDPLLLLSGLAAHTKNLGADPRCSLMVADVLGGSGPLTRRRATLLGTVSVSGEGDDRAAYLERHPAAARYVDFGDFAIYRLAVARVRYIEGFGEMSWFDGDDWRGAEPDPLAAAAPGIIEHMNQDHADALLLYTHVLCGCPEAEEVVMEGIDQHGFDMRVLAPTERRHRVAFDEPIRGRGGARRALVALVQHARERRAPK